MGFFRWLYKKLDNNYGRYKLTPEDREKADDVKKEKAAVRRLQEMAELKLQREQAMAILNPAEKSDPLVKLIEMLMMGGIQKKQQPQNLVTNEIVSSEVAAEPGKREVTDAEINQYMGDLNPEALKILATWSDGDIKKEILKRDPNISDSSIERIIKKIKSKNANT
jgi:hypothetical protein